MATLEQFQGCLLGLAVADALGAPWEGMDAALIYEMGPADTIVEHASRRRLWYTDDTQMTIGVAETLVAQQCIDGDFLAQRFAANYHPDRGYGQGARQIINAIGFGEDWRALVATIFEGQGSLGNGAAMRASPIGLFFAHDLNQTAAQAEANARTTHLHPLGIDGARLMAVAAALAVRSAGQPWDRTQFLTTLHEFAVTEEFRWQLQHALQLRKLQSLTTFGNSLEAHRSVMTAILCFADAPDDYRAAIGRAIGQGNDVDTLAAMTGTLVGARQGVSAIPTELVECLEDDHQGRTYLLELAQRLHQIATELT